MENLISIIKVIQLFPFDIMGKRNKNLRRKIDFEFTLGGTGKKSHRGDRVTFGLRDGVLGPRFRKHPNITVVN